MRLFLSKYLKYFHTMYFIIGIILIVLCAQWFWIEFENSLSDKHFYILISILAIVNISVSITIYHFIKNIFWKVALVLIYATLLTGILLPIFNYIPFIVGIMGISILSGTMIFFHSIRDIFYNIKPKQISEWLNNILVLFTIFVSSIMVGFIIAFNNFYLRDIIGDSSMHIIFAGVNANLIITLYYWLGAGLILLSGMKSIWIDEKL